MIALTGEAPRRSPYTPSWESRADFLEKMTSQLSLEGQAGVSQVDMVVLVRTFPTERTTCMK